jgi:uncharacterized protein
MADDDEDEFDKDSPEEGLADDDSDGDTADDDVGAGSDDPFADDDDDFDFPDPNDEDGPEEDDDDDFDFPMPGDDDDDDDDFDDLPDLGEFVPRGNSGGGLREKLSGVSGGMIALFASGSVFLLVLIGLVTWLSLSFEEDDHKNAGDNVKVATSLAGLQQALQEKPKAAPKKKSKPKAEPETVEKKSKPEEDTTAPKDVEKIAAPEKPETKKPASDSAKKDSDGKDTGKDDGKETGDEADDKKPADGKEDAKAQVAKIDPAMIAQTPDGPLPVIAPDGRQAWQVYARPFKPTEEQKKFGKVALIVAGLGLSKTQTLAAIQQLPGEVTLSFAPYARDLGDWIAQARAAGHEVILEVPMEPKNYPNNDPGPHTLLTSKGPTDNIDNLNWLLSRFPGYVGITNFLGEKFTANEDAMLPILQYLKKRGLMYLDSRASRKSVGARLAKEIKMPRAYNTRFIDREASRVSIDARLFELERIAKSTGASVGIGFPYPVTLERLKAWMAIIKDKNIVLVPLSAVANLQTIR